VGGVLCCSVLQCVAVCCSVMQFGAVKICGLQKFEEFNSCAVNMCRCVRWAVFFVAASCIVLRCVAVKIRGLWKLKVSNSCVANVCRHVGWAVFIVTVSCSVWKCVAACCSVLQRVAARCSVLRCVAVWCISAYQHGVGGREGQRERAGQSKNNVLQQEECVAARRMCCSKIHVVQTR